MTDDGAPSVRTALRRAITHAMKQRDREATAVYRIALAAIDNAEAVPMGSEHRAGAIESSAVGVGRTEAQRRLLSEQDMIRIVASEAQGLRDTAESLADTHPEAARQRLDDARLLQTLLDGPVLDG
jgi:hypothetical protein